MLRSTLRRRAAVLTAAITLVLVAPFLRHLRLSLLDGPVPDRVAVRAGLI